MASSILLTWVPSSLLLHEISDQDCGKCEHLWGGEMHAYKMFTFFFHSSSKAFVKSAETALVPFVFINNTLTIKPAQKKKNFVNILQTPC